MKKVWVLDEPGLNSSFPLDRTVVLEPKAERTGTLARIGAAKKNPALAFTLSLLAWGSGQLYLGNRRAAALYLAAMLLFFSALALLVWFPGRFGLAPPKLVWPVMMIIPLALLAWVVNAADAYFRCSRERDEPFLGMDRKVWPVCASLLLPGWGQFLNGQPKKGCFFLIFSVVGICSAFLLYTARQVLPLLATPADLRLFEICLVVGSVSIPVMGLLWLVSGYDAYRSCEEFVRHKQRSQMVGYRLQGRELLAEFVPQCSAVLGLMLAISLGVQGLPKQYYLDYLKHLSDSLLNCNLSIIPELLRKTGELLTW